MTKCKHMKSCEIHPKSRIFSGGVFFTWLRISLVALGLVLHDCSLLHQLHCNKMISITLINI